MTTVERVDAYCKKEGISVKAFERKCGLANSIVHKWRIGRQTPSLRTIARICEATGTEIGAWI